MIARMTLENPETLNVSLTITLPLAEWESLAKQMPQAWPGWQFASLVNGAIAKLTAQVRVQNEEVNS